MDKSMVLGFFILLMDLNLWVSFHAIKHMEKVNFNIKVKNAIQVHGSMIYILVDICNIYIYNYYHIFLTDIL